MHTSGDPQGAGAWGILIQVFDGPEPAQGLQQNTSLS